MSDIILESFRVIILLYAVLYLARLGMNRSELCRRGWSFILAGMGLLLFANLMDVTDNFDSLNRFVVVGNTPVQAFLEKIVGFLGGFLFLIIGLARWIPTVTGVERIEQLNRELQEEITNHKRTQGALKKSKMFLDATGQMAKVGGWELDLETSLLDWTDETKCIHDLPMDYIPTLDEAINFYHPEDLPRIQETIRRSIDQGESFDMELRLITAKGRDIFAHAIGKPHMVNGKTVKLSGTFQDITERKRAERQLHGANANLESTSKLLQNVIESIPVRVFWKDCDLRYLGCNSLFARDAGLSSADELIGKTDYELAWRDQAELYRADDQSVIESGTSRLNYEEPQTTPDGHTMWLSTSKVLLSDSDKNIIGVLGVYNDITERKDAERQMIAAKNEAEELNALLLKSTAKANDLAAQAEWANDIKSQFLANMSHEIRTPMNCIIGFSDMLANENLTTEQKEDVNIVRESARALLTLINDILDLSKIEAGQLDIEKTDCSLKELLDSTEALMKSKAAEKSIDFHILADKDVPAHIQSDPHRLQQCLINLISNALKFTDQGHVHLKVSLHEESRKHTIRFDVEDTGIGIPQNRQQAIFKSFTQVDASTSRKYGGTGLGLTITRQLAELLGGELTLTSEPGKGSVFSLVIPVAHDILDQPLLDQNNALDRGAEKSQITDTATFSGKVLVAEDIEGNQKLMTLMLSKLGVEVVIAEDGNQALQKALSQSFDLIFMDMQMPHMNGYEATRSLRLQEYRIPIVALTAHAMKGDDQKCIDAGCNDYMTKPIDHRELPRVLAKYLPTRLETEDKTIDSAPGQSHQPQGLGCEQAPPGTPSGASGDSGIHHIINWDQLIDRLGDEDTVRLIMPSYTKDIQEHFDTLSLAVTNGDCVSIAAQAHALKGVSRNLGVEQLSDIASRMEKAGGDNDIEASTLLFNGLKMEIDRILAVLSQCDWIEKAKMS